MSEVFTPKRNLYEKRQERRQEKARAQIAYYGSSIALGMGVVLFFKVRHLTRALDDTLKVVDTLLDLTKS